jgi:hypothetical protein
VLVDSVRDARATEDHELLVQNMIAQDRPNAVLVVPLLDDVIENGTVPINGSLGDAKQEA